MASETSTTRDNSGPAARDLSWEDVKRRFGVGQVIQGTVEDVQTYGVFFDVGIPFPAFMDVIDAPGKPLPLGRQFSLKIIQFADWNKQIRVASADDSAPT